MSMYDAVRNFASQFSYEPVVTNQKNLKKYDTIIVAGMGGSQLSAGILKAWKPELQIIQHRDYGLPAIDKKNIKKTLLIASSYSGNTEETIDALQTALKKKMPVAVLTMGGKLLDLAQKKKLPYVQFPDLHLEPRASIGVSLQGILKIIKDEAGLKEIKKLSSTFNASDFEKTADELVAKIKNSIPVIYSSNQNKALAYFWKITFNETAKIPAFYNVFSELNHNEMIGYESHPLTKTLGEKFHFLFLEDANDHARVQKRMEVLNGLYNEIPLPVTKITLTGPSRIYRLLASAVLAEWVAYKTAASYQVSADEVPMIEEFKKRI